MKQKNPLRMNLPCICMLFILLNSSSFLCAHGQNALFLTAGVGVPDYCNMGVRYYTGRMHTAFTLGFSPVFTDHQSLHTVSAGLAYHLGKPSKYTDRGRWYLSARLTDVSIEDKVIAERTLWLQPGFGREFHFNDKTGLSLGLGLGFDVYYKAIHKATIEKWYENDGWLYLGIVPYVGATFFFQI